MQGRRGVDIEGRGHQCSRQNRGCLVDRRGLPDGHQRRVREDGGQHRRGLVDGGGAPWWQRPGGRLEERVVSIGEAVVLAVTGSRPEEVFESVGSVEQVFGINGVVCKPKK